ncbi:MAG: hypothetical protein JJT77_01025 [Crocinitomicaceae bacterium]|nr:hypothetical protein [Crocinitomicaceae bacterium]
MNTKQIYLLPICLLCLSNVFGQIKGTIAEEGRALLTKTTFIIEGKENAKFTFDIAVERNGTVSGIKLNAANSTSNSTPLMMEARKVVSGLRFEEGTHFPKFHHGSVIITMVKPAE